MDQWKGAGAVMEGSKGVGAVMEGVGALMERGSSCCGRGWEPRVQNTGSGKLGHPCPPPTL